MTEHIYDLNKPFQGDLAIYNGIKFVYYNHKWYMLEEAMKWVFNIQNVN